MSSISTRHDAWLTDEGPAAIVTREHLMPVEGADGVLFPATFASGDNFPGGYNLDGDPNGKNVCLIDSVGSQANRIEPLFTKREYADLVPQIAIKAGNKTVNLLEAGHRAGDAVVRCTALQRSLQEAFKASLRGDAMPLAKIAPTSLVFGVWDSRDTQAKMPRLIASTIRAFDVRALRRSAQFVPALDYVGNELLEEPTDKATKDLYAVRGFVHVPASASHGGVIATGGIRRDATLSLAALRLLSSGSDEGKSLILRRYVLGLTLVAFTYRPPGYLRQGCNLVLDSNKPGESVEVFGDGRRQTSTLTHSDALEFARNAAREFGVGENQTVEFDRELAKRDIQGEDASGARSTKKARKKS